MLSRPLLMLSFLLLIGGCAGVPKIPSHTKATILSIDALTLLPIVTDTPLSPESRQKILTNVYSHLTLDFALKGYVLEKAGHFSENRGVTSEDVAKMTMEDLTELGPKESKYLLLCVFKESDSTFFIIGEYAEAGLYALIIDKKRKKIIWQNEDEGVVMTGLVLGGLIQMLLIDEENLAIYRAIRNLFSTIPEKSMN